MKYIGAHRLYGFWHRHKFAMGKFLRIDDDNFSEVWTFTCKCGKTKEVGGVFPW